MEEKKEKGNFWLTVATFIVNKRKAFLVLFAIACIYCAACMNKVSVNQDITKYLPADSETRIGLTLMDEQFMTYGSARIMVSNITWQDADALVEKLEAVEGVKEVAFDDSADHYNGTNALFDVTFDGAEDDEISKDAKQAVKELLSDYDTYISTSVGSEEEQTESLNNDMNLILVLAVVIIVVVLLISTKAYMEIPVLLITFGVAALLNKGTNYLMGTISSVTDSISVVLQLALAIDYAIIFCDRFMEEHETMDAESAIKVALSKAIPEISSSSLTTISGMVAMMFMHFRLGYDMGIVLVKAIIFSLISVFFLMPAILMIFAKGIDNTHHKSFVPNISFAGKWANLTRFIVPPVFVILLCFAAWMANNCSYLYDVNSVPAARESETRIARHKIEDEFGVSNQIAILVPKGDYESEKKVLKEFETLDYVNTVTGLANVSINDDYVLTDKIAPRAFSELTDLDIEIVRVLYMAYAYEQGQNGPIFTGIDEYKVPIIDMFLFLYDQYEEGYVTLDADMDEKLTDLYNTLHDAQLQLQGEDYSRLVLTVSVPTEGDEAYTAMDDIRNICAKYYNKSDVILVGDCTSNHDLMSSFATDNIIISVLTALFVMIILLFTFQSAGLPILLVLTIQGSIWINFSVPTLTGGSVFFIAYLIVSAIQMGATIDYAIVISSRYMVLKKQMPIHEAIIETINQAFPTIFTSGTILTGAGFLIGQIASDATVASIGIALGRGTLISIILVLFVLPQILLLGDIIIEKTALTINLPQATRRDVSGRMIVNGRVKGYIQGEIDAEIKGSFSGSMQASFESRLPIGGKETELVMEQEGLTQPDDAAKPDTAAQPDDVSQPNTAAQPGEQDAKKEDSDEEQNEQL